MVQYQLPKLTDTVKIILIAHGVSFIIFIFAPVTGLYFILSFQENLLSNMSLIYRIFTYPLVNPNNIIGLLFFALFMWWVGSRLEESWGKKTFIYFYTITAGVSGIVCLLFFHLTGISSFVAGITGITFAIIAVFAFLTPNSPFYIFGIFPLKVKWLLFFSLILTFADPTPIGILYNLILQIITAFIAVSFVIINFPLPTWANPYLGKLKNRIENIKYDFKERNKFDSEKRNKFDSEKRNKFDSENRNRQNKFSLYKGPEYKDSESDTKKISEEEYEEARKKVDKLLDKIRKEGIDSLTKGEKKFLDKNSKDYESPDNE